MEQWKLINAELIQFRKENSLEFREFNRYLFPVIFNNYKDKLYSLAINETDILTSPIWNISKVWIDKKIDLLTMDGEYIDNIIESEDIFRINENSNFLYKDNLGNNVSYITVAELIVKHQNMSNINTI